MISTRLLSVRTGLAVVCAASFIAGCQTTARPPAASPSARPAPLARFVREAPPRADLLEGTGAIAGNLLSEHWYASGQQVVDRQPLQDRVLWPVGLNVSADGMAFFRVATSIPPARVQVREFLGSLEPTGVPTHPGSLSDCVSTTTRDAPCRSSNVAALTIRLRVASRSEHVVLYVEWYVPPSLRAMSAIDDPVVSASWGFSIGTTAT